MNRLGKSYDSLSGFYPDAKAVIASEGMSYMKILGMYAPFTIEANPYDSFYLKTKKDRMGHILNMEEK